MPLCHYQLLGMSRKTLSFLFDGVCWQPETRGGKTDERRQRRAEGAGGGFRPATNKRGTRKVRRHSGQSEMSNHRECLPKSAAEARDSGPQTTPLIGHYA